MKRNNMHHFRALAVCAVLAGCSSAAVEPPPDVAIYEPDGQDGMTEALEGVLVRDSGCTYITLSSGERVVPIFPSRRGVRWDGDELHAGGESYAVGSKVVLGGGGASNVGTLPADCDRGAKRFLVAP